MPPDQTATNSRANAGYFNGAKSSFLEFAALQRGWRALSLLSQSEARLPLAMSSHLCNGIACLAQNRN
jgi:hypothetical protein